MVTILKCTVAANLGWEHRSISDESDGRIGVQKREKVVEIERSGDQDELRVVTSLGRFGKKKKKACDSQ